MKEWQIKWKCAICSDVIFSKYEGEFVRCQCGAIAVDQTAHYSRFIGDINNFLKVPKE